MTLPTLLAALALASTAFAAGGPVEGELIFPPQVLHNHSSSIVELPNGDLLVCWYNGSGERTADDVKVLASRRRRGEKKWSEPFLLHDTPGFPDTNPILFVDSKSRLWFVWPVILANRWETALTRFKISTSGWAKDPPHWDIADDLLLIPRNFEARVKDALAPRLTGRAPGRDLDEARHALAMAGDKYFSRMGWMPRTHPLELPTGRVLVPLYSDGYNFSLVAITDDGGRTWTTSEPLVSEGGVQPSLVRRRDGTIVAYMRDNGPPPHRVLTARSSDGGVTWSPVTDTEIPNPGSSLEVIALRNGHWLILNNDTERGRHSLAAWLSDDEGATWKWKRHLDLDTRATGAGSFHYPSLIQARDGKIHATYSAYRNDLPKGQPGQSIKHVEFSEEWVRGDDAVSALQRVFDAMAARDEAAIRSLMLPDARITAVREDGTLSGSTAAEFAARVAAMKETPLERIWSPEVMLEGRLATVWAPYDFHRGGRFSHCGVDTAMLVRTSDGWKVSGLSYTVVEAARCSPSPLGEPSKP